MSTGKIQLDIEREAERLGGFSGYALDGLLINIEMAIEQLREDEAVREDEGRLDEPEPRREALLSLAAWSLAALQMEAAHPGHDIYEQPGGRPLRKVRS